MTDELQAVAGPVGVPGAEGTGILSSLSFIFLSVSTTFSSPKPQLLSFKYYYLKKLYYSNPTQQK